MNMAFSVRHYPHNDLGNLAHYHLAIINRKAAQRDREGISLDCMSFLIALAFAVEALINFVGSKKVANWKEKAPYTVKVSKVLESAGIVPDEKIDPYVTLEILKKIRDQLAHGKPAEFNDPAQTRAELRDAMAAPWDEYLDPDFCSQAYDHVTKFKRHLLKSAGISLGASLTNAVRNR